MILLIQLLILQIVNCQAEEHKNINPCQSGLREDNTNYIYCARQNLIKVPVFFPSSTGKESKANQSSLIKNVIYDELVLSDNFIASIDEKSFSNYLKVISIK